MTAFERHEAASVRRQRAAQVDGRHYSTHAVEVKRLLQAGDLDAAAGLLVRLIEAIEREAEHPLAGHDFVPPWYFRQLALVYRKAGMLEARTRLLQRQALLQSRVEMDGLVALERLRTAAPSIQSHTAPSMWRRLRAVVSRVSAR